MIYIYINTKIIKYGDKFYTKFRGLNVREDDIECETFTVIAIGSLLAYENKCCLLVYLDNCVYKIAKEQMTDYHDDNFFED